MTVETILEPERSALGVTHVVKVTHEDLTAAATSETIQIFPESGTLPAGTRVECVGHRVVTAFSGGSVSALTVTVGDGGDADRLCTAALDDLVATGYTAVPRSVGTQPFTFASADAVDATFAATGDNVVNLSAGEIHIFLKVTDLRTLSNDPAA